jgi:small-conductance mechanosensitive channel
VSFVEPDRRLSISEAKRRYKANQTTRGGNSAAAPLRKWYKDAWTTLVTLIQSSLIFQSTRLFLFLIILVGLGLFFFFVFPTVAFASAPLAYWFFFASIVVGAWPLASLVVYCLLSVINYMDTYDVLLVYVEGVQSVLTAVAYFAGLVISSDELLMAHGLDLKYPYINFLRQTLANLLWTFVFYVFQVLLQIHVVVRYQQSNFAEDVQRALFREKLLGKLIRRRRKLMLHHHNHSRSHGDQTAATFGDPYESADTAAAPSTGSSRSLPSVTSSFSIVDLGRPTAQPGTSDPYRLPSLQSLAADNAFRSSLHAGRFAQFVDGIRTRKLKTVVRAADVDAHQWNEVNSREDAMQMAAIIFENLVYGTRHDPSFVTINDMARLLGHSSDSDIVRHVWKQFHCEPTSVLTQQQIHDEVVSIYKQRKWLANNLADIEGITLVLSRLLAIPFWCVVLIAWLVSYGYPLFTVVLPLSSLFLGLSFAFGSTAQKMFESAVLVLGVRPFNVGDRIKINNTGDTCMVKQIGLFATRTVTTRGEEVTIPNSVLFSNIVNNLRRNPFASIWTYFHISVRTPPDILQRFKDDILAYCRANNSLWEEPMFESAQIDDAAKLTIACYLRCKCSWQSVDVWIPAKTAFIEHVAQLMVKYDIQYYPPTLRVDVQHKTMKAD